MNNKTLATMTLVMVALVLVVMLRPKHQDDPVASGSSTPSHDVKGSATAQKVEHREPSTPSDQPALSSVSGTEANGNPSAVDEKAAEGFVSVNEDHPFNGLPIVVKERRELNEKHEQEVFILRNREGDRPEHVRVVRDIHKVADEPVVGEIFMDAEVVLLGEVDEGFLKKTRRFPPSKRIGNETQALPLCHLVDSGEGPGCRWNPRGVGGFETLARGKCLRGRRPFGFPHLTFPTIPNGTANCGTWPRSVPMMPGISPKEIPVW